MTREEALNTLMKMRAWRKWGKEQKEEERPEMPEQKEVDEAFDVCIKLLQSSLPSNLNEAASKYESNLFANYYQDSGYTDNDVIDAFKAGAKWDRAKMMGKAVSGRYMKADGKVYVESWLLDIDPDSVKVGDKVKVIVIQEED